MHDGTATSTAVEAAAGCDAGSRSRAVAQSRSSRLDPRHVRRASASADPERRYRRAAALDLN
jgi:hypothetical protein